MRRPGFAASPRVVVPALIAVVGVLALASIGSGAASSARVAATVVVGAAILLVLGALALLSRSRRPGSPRDSGQGVDSSVPGGPPA